MEKVDGFHAKDAEWDAKNAELGPYTQLAGRGCSYVTPQLSLRNS